jgi:hypothetical protein
MPKGIVGSLRDMFKRRTPHADNSADPSNAGRAPTIAEAQPGPAE